MALLKFLRRSNDAPAGAAGTPTAAAEAVQAARQQARRRLIGAVVLLGVGVLGFPLVFQTQPRPIPVDIPIEIPKRESVGPLGLGTATSGATPQAVAPVAAQAGAAASAPVVEPIAPSGLAQTGAQTGGLKGASVDSAGSTRSGSVQGREVEVEVLRPTGTAATAPMTDKPAPAAAAASAAQQSAAAVDKLPEKGRFVVQAGSYTDAEAATLREVRGKLERMGLKTYTQTVQIDGVNRTRVRVGPYNSKQEALDVQNKIKAAGVSAALFAL